MITWLLNTSYCDKCVHWYYSDNKSLLKDQFEQTLKCHEPPLKKYKFLHFSKKTLSRHNVPADILPIMSQLVSL